MINTPHWEAAKQRMTAMLQSEKLDRPCIQITVPKEPEKRVPAPRGLHDPRQTDLDELLGKFEAHFDSMLYGRVPRLRGTTRISCAFPVG